MVSSWSGRPSKRRSAAPARQPSLHVYARSSAFGGNHARSAKQGFLQASLTKKTSEAKKGAKFPRWENFASSKTTGLGRL